MNVLLAMVDVKCIVLIQMGHLHALVMIMKYLMLQDYSVLVRKNDVLKHSSLCILLQIMMSVPPILMTVNKFARTQSHTGLVVVMLATCYVLMEEHVKVIT